MFETIFLIPGILLLAYSGWWLVLAAAASAHRLPETFNGELPGETVVLIPAYRPGPRFREVLESLHTALAGMPRVRVMVLLQQAGPEWDRTVRRYGFMAEAGSFEGRPGNPYHHALRYANAAIRRWSAFAGFSPERLLLLDKDNRISAGALRRLLASFGPDTGYVQGRRAALCENGSVEAADSLSEMLNDQLFRKGLGVLTGVPELSGSGALFRFSLFEAAVASLDPASPGMDKALMSELIRRNATGVYESRAVLHEEKTGEMDTFRQQRTRWLGMQYYIGWYHGLKLAVHSLRTGRPAGLLYAFTLLRPPRSLHLILAAVLGLAEAVWITAGFAPVAGAPLFLISLLLTLPAFVSLLLVQPSALAAFVQARRTLPSVAVSNTMSAVRGIRPTHRGVFIHTRHKAA